MKIHELATRDYESKDDLVVDIAEAIVEYDSLDAEATALRTRTEELESEVARLKEKNLDLLSKLPNLTNERKEEKKEEEIKEEEIFY